MVYRHVKGGMVKESSRTFKLVLKLSNVSIIKFILKFFGSGFLVTHFSFTLFRENCGRGWPKAY